MRAGQTGSLTLRTIWSAWPDLNERAMRGHFGLLPGRAQRDSQRCDGRDCVLVQKLRVRPALEQKRDAVELNEPTVELHPVHQNDGERDLVLAQVVEEGVLQAPRALHLVLPVRRRSETPAVQAMYPTERGVCYPQEACHSLLHVSPA